MADENKIPGRNLRRFNKTRKKHTHLCHAPFASMSVGMNGMVAPCCYSLVPSAAEMIASLENESLTEIWNGSIFNGYRELMHKKQLPDACSICREKLLQKNYSAVKIREYDHLPLLKDYPSSLEISIDNSCNLECVMCNSVNSSRIAETAGIKSPEANWKKDFYRQVEAFLPHVSEMIFTGGEPLLSKIYFKIWEQLLIVNPECKITLNTNASVLPERFLKIIEKGDFHFNISLDSIQKETYERIRLYADYDTVIQNFHFLNAYAQKKGSHVSVAVCPLVKNHKELAELVRFCSKNEAYIFFVHVFGAHKESLQSAEIGIIEETINILSKEEFAETTEVEKQNKVQLESLISDLKAILPKRKKEKAAIAKIPSENEAYQVLRSDLLASLPSDTYRLKTERVLKGLPVHLRSAYFLEIVLTFSLKEITEELDKKTEEEIIDDFITLFKSGFGL